MRPLRLTASESALLTALTRAAPEPLPVLTLARVLWPEGDVPGRPRHTIETHLSRLRAALRYAGDPRTVAHVRRRDGSGAYALVKAEDAGCHPRLPNTTTDRVSHVVHVPNLDETTRCTQRNSIRGNP